MSGIKGFCDLTCIFFERRFGIFKEDMRRRYIIGGLIAAGCFAFSGCETTNSGTTQVTGKTRSALTEWDVDIYQNPAGLLSWIPDMDIPVRFEEIAKLESSGTTASNSPSAIDDKTAQIVTDLKKRGARMGANGIVLREVNVAEDVIERQSSGYENVRFPDGSIRQVEAPVRISYQRVYKVTIKADSVFLDWNTVWTGEPTTSN